MKLKEIRLLRFLQIQFPEISEILEVKNPEHGDDYPGGNYYKVKCNVKENDQIVEKFYFVDRLEFFIWIKIW